VGFLHPSGTKLSLMNLRPWKIPFRRLGTSMKKSTTRQTIPRIGRRKVNYDSRRRGLNHQILRILRRVIRRYFPVKV
jgi:hypothetical protein